MATSVKISSIYNKEGILGFLPDTKKLVTVLIGTYTVMFIGCGSLFIEEHGDITLLGVALAWSSVVTANIYTCGHISGAHINPAITFALALAKQFPWKQVPMYVLTEMLGSLLASLTLWWIFHKDNMGILLTHPVEEISDLRAMGIEGIITFIYAMASYSRADPRATKELGGVSVGATVFFAAIMAGKITGASMNPARSLGPAIMIRNFNKIWIYIVGPLIGAIAASALYFFQLMPKNDGLKNSDHEGTSDESNSMHSNVNPVFTSYFCKSIDGVNSILSIGKSMEMV